MSNDATRASSVKATPRYRNVSGKSLNRRVVLKAAAGLSAMAAAGGAATLADVMPRQASAQEIDGTRAREWVAADHIGGDALTENDGWVSFQAEFPFFSIGVGWSGDVGLWPIIELQLSYDGSNWSDTWNMTARVDDGGREAVDGRLFTDLLFADGEEFVRYRTVDNEGNLAPVEGLAITYIDPTDGPWDSDRANVMMRTSSVSEGNPDTDAPPSIITRAEWGANESYRFNSFGEIWPREYATVQHAIVHHAAVNYPGDGFQAVRSIYYYHAVTQGWGDIGYNYVVDTSGKIFEGRVGGQNVIGGHSYEYAVGSSGICIMGDFQYQEAPVASKAALAHILAFVTRDLDTYATRQFHQVPNLPTICAHRDVNQTSCPGNFLYADLPEIRDVVAATLDAGNLDTGNSAGIVPGDRVVVQTDDGQPLNIRSAGSATAPVVGTIPNGTATWVLEGPITDPNDNWYKIQWSGVTGWVSAYFLIVSPPPPVTDQDFVFGTNMRFESETNMRSRPGTSSSIVRTVSRNAWAFVLAGPEDANGYDWYQVRLEGNVDGWVVKQNIVPAPVDQNPAARFRVGDTVEATTTINIRPRPGIAQTVSATASAGTSMQITVAPIAVTGYIWYGVYSPSFGGGWVVENTLRAAAPPPPPPSGDLVAGDPVRVTETLNMRSGAGTGNSIIATLPAGTTGTVLEGPRTGSGYTWYRIQTSYGAGWVVRNWIAKTTPTPPPSAKFVVGDTFRTTATLNMRSGASTGNGIVATLPSGTTGTILGGPRTGSGYTWWQIRTSQGTGWAVQDWMTKTTTSIPQEPAPPPPTTGRFAIGAGVRVTEALNMRSGPSTGNGIIATLPAGTTGTVLEGPRTGSGYTWWRIQTSRGTGWVVENWLAATSDSTPLPTGKFVSGDTARVTGGALNMRSGPSTGNSIIATLPDGHRVTITGSSRTGSGYTWWPVRSTTYGSGWAAENWLTKV